MEMKLGERMSWQGNTKSDLGLVIISKMASCVVGSLLLLVVHLSQNVYFCNNNNNNNITIFLLQFGNQGLIPWLRR